jgi:hypothetical protein
MGGSLLAVIVASFWVDPNDHLAFWLAGQRLAGLPVYVSGEAAFAPYAHYDPPPLAQVPATLTLFVPTYAYLVAYRALELLVTWELAGRRILSMLALIAVLPVAVELRFEDVHLLVALGIVVGPRR